MKPDAYLENLATSNTVIEPPEGPHATILEDGGAVLEFLSTHLAIRLPGPDGLASLEAAIAGAREQMAEIDADEARILLDDDTIWPA